MSNRRGNQLILAVVLELADAQVALAHGGEPHRGATIGPRDWDELWRTWGLEPGVVIPLAVSGVLYARGLWRLWRDGRTGRGIRGWEALCFGVGWLALAVALV